MFREHYIAQVRLLLDCLPVLKEQNVFALKGGTAINFFIQNLPRLSVDIDLTYIRFVSRDQAIEEIQAALRVAGQAILKRNKRYQVKELVTREGKLKKLLVSDGAAQIKIEPNFTMRGTLLPIVNMGISKSVEQDFEFSVKGIPILAKEELYAGKICAALSRQHPRDFFDVKQLLDNQGLTELTRQAFVAYLVCSPRPMHELLRPNLVILKDVYENEFLNMTEQFISLEELLSARETLIRTIHTELSEQEKRFIFSVKKGEPDYSLMPFENLEKLPALQWKVLNVKRMEKLKHIEMLEKLEAW